jgi:hypothetical protein
MSSNQGSVHALAVLAGSMVAPTATPALVWATIAADLPLVLVILELLVMATISNWLSRKALLAQEPRYGARHGDRTEIRSLDDYAGRRRLDHHSPVGV